MLEVFWVTERGSPKFQNELLIVLPGGGVEVFMKLTVWFKHPIVVVKLVVGARPNKETLIVSLAMQLFVFVATIEYSPGVNICKELLFEPSLHV